MGKLQEIKDRINKEAVKAGVVPKGCNIVGSITEINKGKKPPIDYDILPLNFYSQGGGQRGTSVLIWGPPGCGKTGLCLEATAKTLDSPGSGDNKKGVVVWLAQEYFPNDAARLHGIDEFNENLVIINCNGSGEKTFDLIREFTMQKGEYLEAVDLIVLDSVAALIPKTDIAKIEDAKGLAGNAQSPGTVAKMMAEFMREIQSLKLLRFSHLMMISQATTQINTFHSPDTSKGGNATRHGPNQIYRFTKVSGGDIRFDSNGLPSKNSISGKKEKLGPIIGHEVKYTLEKDTLTGMFQGATGSYDVYYGYGADNATACFDLLVLHKGISTVAAGKYIVSDSF